MAVITSERSIPGLPADAGTLAQRSLDSKQIIQEFRKQKLKLPSFQQENILIYVD